jgi:hypothetical protein
MKGNRCPLETSTCGGKYMLKLCGGIVDLHYCECVVNCGLLFPGKSVNTCIRKWDAQEYVAT